MNEEKQVRVYFCYPSIQGRKERGGKGRGRGKRGRSGKVSRRGVMPLDAPAGGISKARSYSREKVS